MYVAYDLECYKNIFSFTAEMIDCPISWQYEISYRRNECQDIINWMIMAKSNGWKMVGFNNESYDYPMLHFLWRHGNPNPEELRRKNDELIMGSKEVQFANMIWPKNRIVYQVDLFKMHHFDNKAKMTSLKALEFNMRMDSVEDLPFRHDKILADHEMDTLLQYNHHDVKATKKFFLESLPEIELRRDLGKLYGKDFTNCNDVKIGKLIIQSKLEQRGIECYEYTLEGRKPKQTKRKQIHLADCVPDYISFSHPSFQKVLDRIKAKVITNTKGEFKHVANVGGLEWKFGTGGIHASVSDKVFESTEEEIILDADVTSMYTSVGIENEYYPEHLGYAFCEEWRGLRVERLKHKKGTPANLGLKLGLNGAFGASNDQYSIIYDPLMTMKITITGQLVLAMLADRLLEVPNLRLIQGNTDGITAIFPRKHRHIYDHIYREWEKLTKVDLEFQEFKRMFIADVNSYLAIPIEGKIKIKGRYNYKPTWSQDHGELVVPKVTAKVLTEGAPIRKTIEEWPDIMDFMCRVKTPRSSTLVGEVGGRDVQFQKFTRYYVSKQGVRLFKIMPPLKKKPGVWRRIAVKLGWNLCVCNNIKDAILPIDYDYYVEEVEKLVLGFTEESHA